MDGLVSCKSKTRNRPGIGEFLNELKRETFEKYNCVTVGEASGVDYKDYEEFIGKDGYFSMIFDFHYADIDVESGTDWFKRSHWQVRDFKELLAQSQETIQQAGWAATLLKIMTNLEHCQNLFIQTFKTHDRLVALEHSTSS